ncbi:MAG: lysine--tRNA ligase [Candidatus Zambryskibacteria bacterium CG11_big_fil_rev_8_21_14_0_20_42_18]|uniref:Lysine--tRNA ligase n=1 Tax=Candidatus Zambryskibacteria bacterium CG_4_9_14_3_um_filter_42_15 TaxID=1975112 RepID=A0A2M7WSB8_9BACT|nr:MAG: lysine--tRNA ligase [Candidatus Zambryskibacteria bacterium CG11_big_fil_rev_8_21_14_0_20_42_18]PJA32899.1 MAG: lysine--tRNA ligase [Candidatus Zambryskibacteria bacterium CG_4_9_14_3_um_filter_42_15]
MASLEEIRQTRLEKLSFLIEKGIDPYPVHTNLDVSCETATVQFKDLAEAGRSLYMVGRIMSLRAQGKIIFLDFNDGTGRFQALLKKGEPLSSESFELFEKAYDIGDFIEIKGTLFLTKKEEKTILAEEIRMLSKSLRPLPEKWHGLSDVEERFRKRYLDLLSNEEVKERFIIRAKIINLIKQFYNEAGFIEVDLPNLQPLAGGATALPFKTHHNALDIDFYLPIAQELYLKELLAGGMNKVFEIGKRFRNEGIDTSHNPEFSMLESNEAYADAVSQRDFIERLFKFVVKGIFGKLQFEYQGQEIDLEGKFKIMPYPKITDEEYKREIRPTLIQPTFIIDYPVSFNPFAKRKAENPSLIDRFQLVMGGLELVNAFSELNNPIDQRERYLEEDKKGKAGNKDISPSDQEYLEAMEYGMPPNGGIGIGLDRLIMLLTNTKNIKEVILFPTLKPKD